PPAPPYGGPGGTGCSSTSAPPRAQEQLQTVARAAVLRNSERFRIPSFSVAKHVRRAVGGSSRSVPTPVCPPQAAGDTPHPVSIFGSPVRASAPGGGWGLYPHFGG